MIIGIFFGRSEGERIGSNSMSLFPSQHRKIGEVGHDSRNVVGWVWLVFSCHRCCVG